MKKRLLILLSIFLFACNSQTQTSSESKTSNLNDEISIYTFNDDLEQNNIDKHEFTYAYKEYQGITTPTDSSLLTFTLSDDNTYYIVSDREYKLNTSNLVIPSTYNSLPVQEIADEGFAYKSWLTSVVIPSSIKKIGKGAFNGTALKTIFYDASEVEDFSAKNWVFYNSENNQDIDIYFGKNVKKIPNRLFFPLATEPNQNCNVKNIYFSEECSIESIGDYAFYKLDKIKNITLPKTIKYIGNYAFYESGIEEIDLANVQEIGEYAFSFSKIAHINLKNNETIKEGAFSYCYNLINTDFQESNITIINDFLFKNCYKLENVKFNKDITSIGKEAFSHCTSLLQFFAPENLISIKEKAFYENTALEDVKLNKNLKKIENYAFYNTKKLNKLYIQSNLDDFSLGNYIFVNAGKEATLQVAFLENVEKIPMNFMFQNSNEEENPLINEVILPRSLKEIGVGAFFDLNIQSIWFLGTESEYKAISIGEQNNTLNNVKYAIVTR